VSTNGRLPESSLGFLPGSSRQLLRQLVPQTVALCAAFQAHFGKPLVITDAYRTYAEQVALKAAKGAYAATPGTSNHGWGRAIDFGSFVNVEGSPEYRWMKANAPRFGWSHPRWAEDNSPVGGQQEPWHWEANDAPVPVSNYLTAGGTIPTVPDIPSIDPLEETDMTPDQERLLREVHAAIGAGGAVGLADAETALGVARTIRSSTNGVPDVLASIRQDAAAIKADTWDVRLALSNSLPALKAAAASGGVDETALAKALAPLLTTGLTEAQVVAAVRSVFADAGHE